MKILLCGYDGAMGQVFSSHYPVAYGFAKNKTERSFPIVDDLRHFNEKVDVIVDFSHPALFAEITDYAKRSATPLVIATTGLTDQQMASLDELGKSIPVLQSGNFSRSMIVLTHLVRQSAALLSEFDIEILEKHHRYKVDAPSGTALMLYEAAKKEKPQLRMSENRNHLRTNDEVGMQSLRGGTVSGEHSVFFFGEDEYLRLEHTALSKDIFAHGAYEASEFIVKQKAGRFSYEDVVFND